MAVLGKGSSFFLSCRRAVLGLCVLLAGPHMLYEAKKEPQSFEEETEAYR